MDCGQTVMALSDAQIVSGIAIMISGYYAVTRGLSGYHWKMVTRIAWFSTITHLAALSCLRTYLHENPVKRGLRLFFMGSLSIMLITATMAQADVNFQDSRPAICFLQVPRSRQDIADPDVIFSVVLLIYNIILRALKLHQKAAEGASRFFRSIVATVVKPTARFLIFMLKKIPVGRLQLLFYMVIVQPYVVSLMLAETYVLMYTSAVSEVRHPRGWIDAINSVLIPTRFTGCWLRQGMEHLACSTSGTADPKGRTLGRSVKSSPALCSWPRCWCSWIR